MESRSARVHVYGDMGDYHGQFDSCGAYERLDCRLCGGNTEVKLRLKDTPIANDLQDFAGKALKYPLELSQCIECEHVQIRHVIHDSIIFTSDYVYQTPEANRPYLKELATELATMRKGLAVEIGSNNGLFLNLLAEAGFDKVIGVDPCGSGTTFWKLPFNPSTAQMIVDHSGQADLIVANNVLAHIDDLNEVFDGIQILLSPKGLLVFEVQDFKALADNGLFDMIYHEHRDYHTINPLLKYILRKGLYPNKVEHIPNHGGSIRFYCSYDDYVAYPVNESINWDALQAKINTACNQNVPRGTVLFGAPAKAVTLLYNMDCMDNIAFCVDDTPSKQGKYLPGTDIKIYPTSKLHGFKGQVLLAAWNYKEVIQAKFPEIQFINPHA